MAEYIAKLRDRGLEGRRAAWPGDEFTHVARTFVRILKRDATSYLNVAGGFTPSLPSAAPGTFTFADLVHFAGVTQP